MAEKKISLACKIHDEILKMVIQLSAEQEDIVFTEGGLVEKFGVSKAPVREALVKLCSEGVLKSVPRYGYLIVRLNEKDARDIAQFRVILELNALKQAFSNIHEEELKILRNYLDNESHVQDVWDNWENNQNFHCLLASFSGNRFLEKSLRESMTIQKRVFAQLYWQNKHSMEYILNPCPHEAIYKALKDQDQENALYLLRKDIMGGNIEE